MAKIWITSDWHLHHHNIIQYENRPTDYEDQIIRSLQVVKPEDIVINVGDLYLGSSKSFLPLFDRIHEANPGYKLATKILIEGNHDNLSRTKYTSIGMVLLNSITLHRIYFNHHGVEELPSDTDSQIYGHYHSNAPLPGLARGRKFSIEEQQYKLLDLASFINKVPIVEPKKPIALW